MPTTRKLWQCANCGREVNAFVNGAKCPDCGWTRGREAPQ